MLARWQLWTLCALAGASLGLVALNITLFVANRDLQSSVAQRQRAIDQGIRLSNLNTQIVRSLATLAAQTGDAQIRDLLAEHGISFKVNPPAGGGTGTGQ